MIPYKKKKINMKSRKINKKKKIYKNFKIWNIHKIKKSLEAHQKSKN